jgi:DNA polymerase III subunit delta
MNASQALKEIAAGKPHPLYICYGTEKYRLQQFLSHTIDRLIEAEYRDFAVSKFDLMETPIEAVIEDAETLPFMAPRKLVIAQNARFLTGVKEQGKVEHNLDVLLQYVQSPADYSVLVLIVDADKLDERKKIVKTFKEMNIMVPFMPLTADELLDWVKHQAEKGRFTFAPGAAEQLILFTGGNLQLMAPEMDKISLYLSGATGQTTLATVEIIEKLVARSTEQNVFLLIEEMANLRLEKAFSILEELLKQKEEPIKISALMARQFRIILQVKELMKQGYSHQQAAGHLGLHPYAVKIAEGQGRKFDMARLCRILSDLTELDYSMKTGGIDKVMGLELFLMKLAI